VASTSYSGNFTLNYNDGLRTQTELKELRGTGSSALSGVTMLKRISPLKVDLDQFNLSLVSDRIDTIDVNKNGFQDQLESYIDDHEFPRVVLRGREGLTQRTLFTVLNHLSKKYYQGFKIIKLDRDYNKDGVNDILLGIYKKIDGQFHLVGYDIICQRRGRIIIRYLNAGGK
jgi:hypothetical protein